MPDVVLPPLAVDPELCVVSRWNLSLSARARWAVFGVLTAISLTLAGAFAAVGAWMILPYSLLELAVLAGAFHYVARRARDWERLTVAGDRVIVERAAGGQYARREFNRPWLRVELEEPRFGARRKLMLHAAGEQWEFGDALLDRQRSEIAATLRRLSAA